MRLLMTADLLARKRADMATDTAFDGRWKSLKRIADSTALTENRRDWLPTLSAMYLLTGDPKYVRRAEVLLAPIAVSGLSLITPDSGKPVGQETFQVALAYDWMRDALSPAVLASTRATLELWGRWPFPETNPSRAGKLGTDAPWSNYHYEFLRAAWLAGLALQGDSPSSAVLLDLCRSKWTNRALPWLRENCAGGYHVEGTNYGLGCLVSLLPPLISDVGLDSWLYEALQVQFQVTSPGMAAKAPFGDQASDFPAVQSDTDRFAVLLMAAFSFRADQARWWLDNIARNRSKRGQSLWFEYLFYPSDTLALSYRTLDRLAYRAEGPGYVSSRSGWTVDAVQVQAVCGPKFSDHQDDAGTFILTRGNDALIGHAKQWSARGLEKFSEFVNCLTVDGRGQDNMADKTAKITTYEDTPHHMLVQMDLSRAYDYSLTSSNRIKPLKSYRRTLAFIKPNILMVHDRVEKANAASVVRWHLNHHQTVTPAGNGWVMVKEGASEMHVAPMIPNTPLGLNPLNLGSGGAVSSWKTNLVYPVNQPVDEFLVAFQCGPTGFTPLPVTKTPLGVQVGDDEFQIDAGGTVTFVDHRISPKDQALLGVLHAAEDWQATPSEAAVAKVVTAAQRLLAVVQQGGPDTDP